MLRLPLILVALALLARHVVAPAPAPADPWVRHTVVTEERIVHHKNAACEICRPGGDR